MSPNYNTDSAQTAKSPTNDSAQSTSKEAAQDAKERIIPIRLETGEEIMPVFTQLEDPEPPKWFVELRDHS